MGAYAAQLIDERRAGEHWLALVAAIDAIFERHIGERDALQHQLELLVKQQYASLITEAELQQALAACPPKHELTAPSWWTTLYKDSNCHITLVAVYQGMAMPLHDHPAAFGVSVVLSGRAQIHTAKCLQLHQATGMAKIAITESKECEQMDVCWIDQENNLHSIEAITKIAHVLVVHTPQVDRSKQAFYFPVEDKPWQTGQRIDCKRIRLRHNLGH